MIEDHKDLLDRVAEFTIEGMDVKCLENYAYESMYTYLESLSNSELAEHLEIINWEQ